MRKKTQPPQPDLFKHINGVNAPVIKVLQLTGAGNRSHEYTYGLDAVCDELSINISGIVTPDTINDCDIALCSLCSVRDMLTLVTEIQHRPQSRLIVGGQGAYAFPAFRHLTHRIAFGRVEDAVDDCILNEYGLSWCYDFDNDPHIANRYVIRQARRLLRGESSVGCAGKCTFCQYSATRSLRCGSDYSAGDVGHAVTEDRWQCVTPKTGNQTTALDGWSEYTRRRVRKPVSDDQIVETLNHILSDISGIMRLKVFQIVGYPWETRKSVIDDINRFRSLMGKVKPRKDGKSRIMMMITHTPFSPEPLTEMENDAANIDVNWRDILLGDEYRCVFDSHHLNVFSLPQIPGPLTLYKRVSANRIHDVETIRKIAAAKTIENAVDVGGDIWREGRGQRVSGVLRVEKQSEQECK